MAAIPSGVASLIDAIEPAMIDVMADAAEILFFYDRDDDNLGLR
jgi:hypothetical protein